MPEGDEPHPVADLGDADSLSGKDVTAIDLATTETDPAAVGDHHGLVVKRVAVVRLAVRDDFRNWVGLGLEARESR
jgi:hypothetical protein